MLESPVEIHRYLFFFFFIAKSTGTTGIKNIITHCVYMWRNDAKTKEISQRNPQLKLKTLLQANCFESSYGKQRVLNTGWLCICSKMYFGSFLTPKKLRTAALTCELYEIFCKFSTSSLLLTGFT